MASSALVRRAKSSASSAAGPSASGACVVGAGTIISTAVGPATGLPLGSSRIRVGAEVGATVGDCVGCEVRTCVGVAVGVVVVRDCAGCKVGACDGMGVGAIVGIGEGAGEGEKVFTETESTDAEDIARRRWVPSWPARRRWPARPA